MPDSKTTQSPVIIHPISSRVLCFPSSCNPCMEIYQATDPGNADHRAGEWRRNFLALHRSIGRSRFCSLACQCNHPGQPVGHPTVPCVVGHRQVLKLTSQRRRRQQLIGPPPPSTASRMPTVHESKVIQLITGPTARGAGAKMKASRHRPPPSHHTDSVELPSIVPCPGWSKKCLRWASLVQRLDRSE